jgi:diguanylate cyclase (GGDEF)-like protein
VLDRFLTKVGTRSPAIGVIAFDLDDFKGVNDDHGHAAGDLVLRGFADAVRTHTRPTDLFVRLGGDEFLLLCPGLDGDGPRQRAQRIVDTVTALRFPAPAEQVRTRCSAGAGVFPAHTVDLDAVDDALYRAKRDGAAVAVVVSGDPVPA